MSDPQRMSKGGSGRHRRVRSIMLGTLGHRISTWPVGSRARKGAAGRPGRNRYHRATRCTACRVRVSWHSVKVEVADGALISRLADVLNKEITVDSSTAEPSRVWNSAMHSRLALEAGNDARMRVSSCVSFGPMNKAFLKNLVSRTSDICSVRSTSCRSSEKPSPLCMRCRTAAQEAFRYIAVPPDGYARAHIAVASSNRRTLLREYT